MTSDTIDFLMSQTDGANYVVMYQMLCLKTINTDGNLSRQIGEVIIPFDEEKIQRDCKYFSIDTVRVGLELFKKLGLIYYDNNQMLQIADFGNMVGSETDYAKQKRVQRSNKGQKVIVDKCMDNKVDNVHESIEIRDKSKKKIVKHKYGLYKNVLFSDKQYDDLIKEFPNDYENRIDRLSEYMESTGKSYKNHLATIKAWDRREKSKKKEQKSKNTFNNIDQRKYDFDALENELLND